MSSVNPPVAEETEGSLLQVLRRNAKDYGMLIVLIAVMVFFQVITGGVLFMPANLTNLVLQNSFVVILALGMLLVIIAGHIDLSVGSIVGVIGALAAILMIRLQINPWVACLICLVAGGAIGAAQGYWIAYHHIPAFIVTLAGMLVFRGLTFWILGGINISPFPAEFTKLSTGFLPSFFTIGGFDSTAVVLTLLLAAAFVRGSILGRKSDEAHGEDVLPMPVFVMQTTAVVAIMLLFGYQLAVYKGIPNILLVMGAMVGAYYFLTTRTTIGRSIYALGGNEKATRLSGINTERFCFYTFVNMGVMAAFAGLIVAARLNSSTPKAGTGFEMDCIAACFIGGASTTGGVGRVTGAVVGAFIMGVLNNGMSIMGLGIDFQQMVKGLVLLAAVVFDLYNKNKG
ncbi:ABC transporter permease [Pleomorphomonas diazotrophica]|uniref:Xylose transport system permease protein XylH n=1 Tax=Pleomorphomonas diazotrophica TaxID=1166257 RepID=A0A1I4VY34_9HYPH|nr:multiple monosaccharide ABC transporter permease [Pleomorphomonas diazotrophica]PKR88289.1 ABC transporter permease [Pleomorphomonas diazotrophica]SFN06141.1 putative multiple sugar transport system permease protein [Pleomorphomonas diazotrophica]